MRAHQSYQFYIRILLIALLCCIFPLMSHAYSATEIQKLSGYQTSYRDSIRIEKAVATYSFENDIDPNLIYAIIGVESSFKVKATNKKTKAAGLMQIYAKYHKKEIGKANIYDIDSNIRIGTKIFKGYLTLCKGNQSCALKKYGGTTLNKYVNKVVRFDQRNHINKYAQNTTVYERAMEYVHRKRRDSIN